MKNNKAITLVALVITIILLLILAGITIAQLTGSGLFEKVKLAQEKYENAQEIENSILADYKNKMDNYISNSRDELQIADYKENLICEYKMDNIIDNEIKDVSGNNINASINGSGAEVKIDTDNKKYINFDGATYINSDEITTLAGNKEVSIMCMFRNSDTTSSFKSILTLGTGNGSANSLIIHSNAGYMRFDTGSYTYCYDPQVIFAADNEWHFTCVTYDTKSLVLYLDNKPIFATNATLNLNTPIIQIAGMSAGGVVGSFNGDIRDVRVYNKGLNIEEVNSIYKNIK